jgi:hypothetical protein
MSHHASGSNFGFPRGDARLDMTDLYVLLKPGDPGNSTIVLNVHPSFRLDSPEPTTTEPFAPGALYEIKIDTNGDAVADICYSVHRATLARYFFTFRDVDHIDRQVRQLGAEGCRKIIATRLDKA